MKHIFTITMLMVLIVLVSCKKEVNTADLTANNVSYEVSGTYSGPLQISYTDTYGVMVDEFYVRTYWLKTVTYRTNIMSVKISVSSPFNAVGLVGQYVCVKLLRKGKVVKEKRVNTGVLGELEDIHLLYVF